jgi:hypothetical protein
MSIASYRLLTGSERVTMCNKAEASQTSEQVRREGAMQHSFKVQVAGVDTDEDRAYEDPFYEAGCDDAMICVIDGVLFLDFDREAPTYTEAVQSACRDIARAGGKVVRVIPESATDVS